MDFSLFQALGFGGTGFAVTLGVLALFWKADDAFSVEFRQLISQRLTRIKVDGPKVRWPLAFSLMFDHIFGKKHLSARCFLSSTVASITFTIIVSFGILSVSFFSSREIYLPIVGLPKEFVFNFLSTFFFSVFAVNIFADYASLLQTRYFIKIIEKSGNYISNSCLIIIDFLVTVLIFFATLIFSLSIYAFLLDRPMSLQYIIYLGEVVILSLTDPYSIDLAHRWIAPLLYSTFFTSFWVWLSAVSWAIIRNLARIQRGVEVLKFVLPIKEKPMRAVGEVASLFVAAAYVVASILGAG